MKRTALAVALLGGALAMVNGQGTIWLNNSDARAGLFFGTGGNPAAPGTLVMILGGINLTSLTPVLSAPPGGGAIFTATDVNKLGPGTGTFFNANYAELPGVPDGGSAFIELLAWYGAADFHTAQATSGAWWYDVRWTQNVGYGGWQYFPDPLEIPVPMHMQPGGIPEPSPARLAIALGCLAACCSRLSRWIKCVAGKRPR